MGDRPEFSGGRLLEVDHPFICMAASFGVGVRGNQRRASKLSQLVMSATERQEQQPNSSISRSGARQSGSHTREADSNQEGGHRGEEEATTFYSDDEDSEDDEDEL